MEAIIDLREVKSITTFGAGSLQDINSWVFFPSQIEFFVSENGTDYRLAAVIKNNVRLEKEGTILKTFEMNIKPIKTWQVKVVATNIGTCLPWHKGQGDLVWIKHVTFAGFFKSTDFFKKINNDYFLKQLHKVLFYSNITIINQQ